MASITLVTSAPLVRRSQAQLTAALKSVCTEKYQCSLGYQGESADATVHYSSRYDLWFSTLRSHNRYWNAFGTGRPKEGRSNSIILEINIPFEGVDRRIGGAFGSTDKGEIVLLHRGRIGGGRNGIGKELFFSEFAKELRVVEDGDRSTEMYSLGSLSSGSLGSKISELVNRIATLKTKSQMGQQVKRPAFLFVWNPSHWAWDHIEESMSELERTGGLVERWSCGNSTKMREGDRFFLIRVGKEPRGIVGAGHIHRERYTDIHWKRKTKYYCTDLEFDTLLNPARQQILTLEQLRKHGLTEQHWTPQGSGITINPEYVDAIEKLWFEAMVNNDLADDEEYNEGKMRKGMHTRYERNPYARARCLEHYGYDCSVCEMNFGNTYGSIGNEFIHVHHLEDISGRGKEYRVDPIKDLRPVCPNCHNMLHRERPAMPIDKLKKLLRK